MVVLHLTTSHVRPAVLTNNTAHNMDQAPHSILQGVLLLHLRSPAFELILSSSCWHQLVAPIGLQSESTNGKRQQTFGPPSHLPVLHEQEILTALGSTCSATNTTAGSHFMVCNTPCVT